MNNSVTDYLAEKRHEFAKECKCDICTKILKQHEDEISPYTALQSCYDKLEDTLKDVLSNTAYTPHEKIEILRGLIKPA